jgi:hypothetical protein
MGEYDDLFDRGEYAVVPLEEQLVKMREAFKREHEWRMNAVAEHDKTLRELVVEIEAMAARDYDTSDCDSPGGVTIVATGREAALKAAEIVRKRLPADAQARAVIEDRPQNRHAGAQVEGDDTRTPLEWPERQPTSPPCSCRMAMDGFAAYVDSEGCQIHGG